LLSKRIERVRLGESTGGVAEPRDRFQPVHLIIAGGPTTQHSQWLVDIETLLGVSSNDSAAGIGLFDQVVAVVGEYRSPSR